MTFLRAGLTIVVLAVAGCTMMKPKTASTPPAPMPVVFLVFFHASSADLTPEARQVVDQAAAKVKVSPPTTVTIAGYTTDIAAEDASMQMARQRVKVVRDALVADGVDSKLFLDIPIGPANDNAGKTGDRRTEIRLQYDK